MNPAPRSSTDKPPRMLEFRSGGWVLWLAGLLALVSVIYQGSIIFSPKGPVSLGDGVNVASYGFDLSRATIPVNEIVAAGLRKDDLPALVTPATVSVATQAPGATLGDVRKLTSHDHVIGVVMHGEARAYPLWVLEWHEIVDDVLGGEPIAVTYSAVSGGVVVFSRRVGDETLEFGVSGLLYNCNLLMFDRRATPAAESLWSQLQFRAVAGPAVGRELQLLPMVVTTYKQWRDRYPTSTVILPNRERKKFYRREAYSTYLNDDDLRFPVSPLPDNVRPKKTPVAAVRSAAGWELHYGEFGSPSVVDVPELADDPAPRAYAFWFAWYAQRSAE